MEINRPAFASLKRVCQYIPYSALRRQYEQAKDLLPYLKPEFLDEIAEGLEID